MPAEPGGDRAGLPVRRQQRAPPERRGDVLPVGGVTHKIEAAAKAGCTKVIIPKANEQDVMIEDEYDEMIEIIPCSNISEVLDVALMGEPKKDSLVDRLKSITGTAFDQGAVGSASGSNPSPL